MKAINSLELTKSEVEVLKNFYNVYMYKMNSDVELECLLEGISSGDDECEGYNLIYLED